MRKILISKSGNVSFIEGPGNYDVTINSDSDPNIEEHNVSSVDNKLWKKWKEERVSAKQIKKELKSSQHKL